MSTSVTLKPKKKRPPVILGCDQCRRRKTKCDQARPTCGPCVYAGLMECTFLMGKTPVPKRKKAQTEVEILEARLETIESAYSERLSQMESLLKKVMPGGIQALELLSKEGSGSSSAQTTLPSTKSATSATLATTKTTFTKTPTFSAATKSTKPKDLKSTNRQSQEASPEWVDIDSPQESLQPLIPKWEYQTTSLPKQSSDSSNTTLRSSELTLSPSTQLDAKDEVYSASLFTPESRTLLPEKSPVPSISHSFTSATENIHEDSDEEDELGGLAATMDKLRLFDASVYFGKGTMLFTSTDQDKFWDEEISFDVHEVPNIEIPQEALVLPPIEVIDELFDIYYEHYYVFLPMIQKASLLQALEDRYEPQSIFLLNCVFMAAAATEDCKHPCCYSDINDPKSLSVPFFERARLVLDYCLTIPRVSTVQGLIMLAWYPKTLSLGLHYLQQAVLMAQQLGLHRKCDRWIPDPQVQETRKRVFWCVYFVDSAMVTVTGRRPLLDDGEIDVPPLVPTMADGESEYLNTLYMAHMCKLWRIYRDVKQYVFNVVEVQDMVPGSLPKLYEQQLIQWQSQLPAALQLNLDIKLDDPGVMNNARGAVAQMLYESALIILHKPYLSSPEQPKPSAYRSQDICIKAACKITEVVKLLVRTYSRTIIVSGIPEFSMMNALRIQVMFMKAPDPKIADICRTHFDYLVRFFREFYSSPRVKIDDQTINCLMTFFDEFMNTHKGFKDATVHVCAGAIKNMAIAKRAKFSMGKGVGHSSLRTTRGPDEMNLSRLVKIGREERAKARLSSPIMSLQDGHGPQRKRHSHPSHEEQQRCGSAHHPSHTNSPLQSQASLASSPSSFGTPQEETGVYHYPGKLQKIAQFVGPFGGPLVVESLNNYQTATAIINQPPSNSAIPQTRGVLTSTSAVFDPFAQHQQQQQQLQQYSRHYHQASTHMTSPQQASITSIVPSQHFPQRQQPAQETNLSQQQSQLLNKTSQSMSAIDNLNPSFWNDFGPIADGQNMLITSSGQATTSDHLVNSVEGSGPAMTSNMTSAATISDGIMNPTMYSIPNSSVYNLSQPQQQLQQHLPTSQEGMFIPMKLTATNDISRVDDDLSADQIQALLDQSMDSGTHNNSNRISSPSLSPSFQGQQFQHQQHLSSQRFLQQQQPQHPELDDAQDFHPGSWHSMM